MDKVITIKTDATTKKAAQKLAKENGLSLSSFIDSHLKQMIVTRQFESYKPEEMTPKLEGLLAEAEAEMKRGDVSRSHDNIEDFIKDLNS